MENLIDSLRVKLYIAFAAIFFKFFFIRFPLIFMDYRIKEILAKIEKEINRPLIIKDLAESVNLSVSYLRHFFKKETGTGIIKYTNDLRLQKAREFLETSHLRVKEIRLKVGISDEAHFSRDFKEKFGETPNEYRKNFRNNGNGYLIAVSAGKKHLLLILPSLYIFNCFSKKLKI